MMLKQVQPIDDLLTFILQFTGHMMHTVFHTTIPRAGEIHQSIAYN